MVSRTQSRETCVESATVDPTNAGSIGAAQRRWVQAPTTGTNLEGLLFCGVALYMAAAVVVALSSGSTITPATLPQQTVASAPDDEGFPLSATVAQGPGRQAID